MGPRLRWRARIESEGEIIMKKEFIEALESAGLTGWLINEIKKESFQLFYVHEKLETVRYVDTVDTKVTIYLRHDGSMGSASFSVYSSTEYGVFAALLENAKRTALSVNDQPYELVACEEASYEPNSNFVSIGVKEAAALVAKAVFKAKHKEGGALNATEVFANKIVESVLSSTGLDKKESYYDVMVETIPTWNGDGESVEIYEAFHINEFNEEEIVNEVEEKLREVEQRYYARKPAESLNVPILLRAPELRSLFESICGLLTYSTLYRQSGLYKEGDAIQSSPEGDKITLSAKGSIPGVIGSGYFDGDGSSYRDAVLIDDGIVKRFFGGNRYAQYLNLPNTGNLPLLEVSSGSLEEGQLQEKPYLECISFSGIQVDPFNDYIGGEVRLAVLHNGKEATPVTGISISGSLKETLNHIVFSSSMKKISYYYGPTCALIEGMKIL